MIFLLFLDIVPTTKTRHNSDRFKGKKLEYRLFPIVAVPESEIGHAYPKRAEMKTRKNVKNRVQK